MKNFDLPAQMKAVIASPAASNSTLQVVSRPLPVPGDHEVLIRVAGAGLNHVDLRQRRGEVPMPARYGGIPGLECSGRIVAIGSRVDRWKIGDLVCALLPGGGYAEYSVARQELCLPLPSGMDPVEAASLPEALFTVWLSLVLQAQLRKGETLLVHGGSSGIGTTAIQLGVLLGATVFVTAGTPRKCAECREFGAILAIDYTQEDFVSTVHAVTDRRGVDVILDMVGGSYLNRNLSVLAPKGRLVQIATMGGRMSELDLVSIMTNRQVVTGCLLRMLVDDEKFDIAQALLKRIWPSIQAGRFKPVIDNRFSLVDCEAAHRHMENGTHIGKVLLFTDQSGAD